MEFSDFFIIAEHNSIAIEKEEMMRFLSRKKAKSVKITLFEKLPKIMLFCEFYDLGNLLLKNTLFLFDDYKIISR